MEDTKDNRSALRRFFAPKPTKIYFLRVALVAVLALLLFGFAFPPFFVSGSSMNPTYTDGDFILGFVWLHAGGLERGDVVFVRLAGKRVMYLKRVVALPGESVAFSDGILQINGEPMNEPYVRNECNWNMDERVVRPGHVYVIGDNRNMDINAHSFGQVSQSRIHGGPLW